MSATNDFAHAAQTPEETRDFVEAFARVTVRRIKDGLGQPAAEVARAEERLSPDWDDPLKLDESGIAAVEVDQETRAGTRYLHVDVASAKRGAAARRLFLSLTGLSDKQQKALFPLLRSSSQTDRAALSREVVRLNAWLDEIRTGGFDPTAFIPYQRSIGIHGRGQNLSGAIGAVGAAIAFVDAIAELSGSIVDMVGAIPTASDKSPMAIYEWLLASERRTPKTLLLGTGRAIVFASSKDANIFVPLDSPFTSAADALERFSAVANDQRERSQRLHEFAVGEVKTATDPANLHERMGLASRETQTELRTDRFLMMALLNSQILSGGVQRRTMNNRDLTRFSHVFNLHHCWGWDGGRERHPEHWGYFRKSVGEWCGL